VIAVSLAELVRLHRRPAGARRQSPWAAFAFLLGGGVFHGLFASGGPLIVSYASRAIPDKRSFRATLSVLWLILNAALLVSYLLDGKVEGEPLRLAALLLPALAAGIAAGEIAHARVNEMQFRKIVQAVLFVTGVFLIIGGVNDR